MDVSAVRAIERHYTTAEICELLSLHEETVRKYARRGELPSVRFGKDRRYPESGVVRFLNARAYVHAPGGAR